MDLILNMQMNQMILLNLIVKNKIDTYEFYF